MAERLIAPVLKTGRPKGLVSSNLTPSALRHVIVTRLRPAVAGLRRGSEVTGEKSALVPAQRFLFSLITIQLAGLRRVKHEGSKAKFQGAAIRKSPFLDCQTKALENPPSAIQFDT